MNCPRCRQPVFPGSAYCSKCGARLEGVPAPGPEDEELITIGRAPDNEIRIEDESVSEHHATLSLQKDGKWRIEDLSSENGTFVRGQRVRTATLLPPDLVRLGGITTTLVELLDRKEALDAARGIPPRRTAEPPLAVKVIVLYFYLHLLVSLFLPGLNSSNIVGTLVRCAISIFFYNELYRLRDWARKLFIFIGLLEIVFVFVFIGIDGLKEYFYWIKYPYREVPDGIVGCLFCIDFIFNVLTVCLLTRKDIVACFKSDVPPSSGRSRKADSQEKIPVPAAQNNDRLLIGRAPDNDICLDDESVSSHHALLIRQEDGSWTLEDLSSRNGVFVNGLRTGSGKVVPDDLIGIGTVCATLAELLGRKPVQDTVRDKKTP